MKKKLVVFMGVGVLFLSACISKNDIRQSSEVSISVESADVQDDDSIREEIVAKEPNVENDVIDEEASLTSEENEKRGEIIVEPEILNFVDVFGEKYEVEINPNVEKHSYDINLFVRKENSLIYDDDKYSSRLGVDVSRHQGYIDWQRVKNAGYDFAIIRLGYRGYGSAGTINLDQEFNRNIENAKAAGLDVGVYFFAQAVNETEAKEEAEFVIENLKKYELQLPVVYDPESILDDAARTDNVSGEQFTKNTEVFCNMIKDAGYKPMIYSNMLWEAYEFDLEKLSDYPLWYADYELHPQTPYNFVIWQYTNEGYVDGISGRVDLDIQLMQK